MPFLVPRFPLQAVHDTLYEEAAALWAPYYHNRQTQLGGTASLINFGDRKNFGLEAAATGTGMKFSATGLSPVWTPSEALSAFDTSFDLDNPANWQGIAPVLTLNGTDENLSTPDVDFWTRVDSGAGSVSIGAWVYTNTSTGGRGILVKDGGAGSREWMVYFAATTRKLVLLCKDDSLAINVDRTSDAGLSSDVWHFVVVTYDGAGGATAMNTAILYSDGVAVASTATNNASYVSMENLAATVVCGGRATSGWWSGKMAGGPFCPFYAQVVLTAEQVANLYAFERNGLGV